MKKFVMSAVAFSALTFAISSCGGESPDELAKKVKEKLEASKADLDAAAEKACEKVYTAKMEELRTPQ